MANQERFQQAMNQGHSAAWDQNWELAADYYRQALEEMPDNPVGLTNLGLALYEQQKYNDALSCYIKSAKLVVNDPLPVEKIARIYERQGKLAEATQASIKAADLYLNNKEVEKAIDNWVRAIGLQPENMMARTRLAMVYERMGRKPDAVKEYLATAAIYQHSGNIAKSQQVIEYCLQIQPDSPTARQALTSLKRNQLLPKPERTRGATGPLRMAEVRRMEKPNPQEISLDPVAETRQKALVRLASILFDSADEAFNVSQPVIPGRKGVATITRGTGALTLDNSNQVRIQLYIGQAIDAQGHGDDKQAVEELEKALNMGLNEAAAFFIHGLLSMATKSDMAIKSLQKAINHTDYALGAQILLGQIYLQQENFTQAAVAYLHALSLADAAVVPQNHAEELLQMYEPIIAAQTEQTNSEAIKKMCSNISSQIIRPNWREYLKTARQQLPQQDPGAAPIPLGEVILESGSSQVVEALARIRQLANLNKISSALEEAYFALKFAPSYLPLHIQIAELLMESGKSQEALHKFILLSTLYELRGEANQSVRLLNRVIQMAPTDTTIRNHLIDVLTNQGKIKEAIQQTMNLAGVYNQLADLEKTRSSFTEALRLAQTARIDRSEIVQILYKIADIDMQRLDLRQATRVFEQIRTIEPDDMTARMHLVDMNFRLGQENAAITEIDSYVNLLENGGKRTRAVDFLTHLIEERGEKLELRKRLADVLVRCGRIPDAVEQLDVIANALLDSGNKGGAISMLKAIVALNPPNVKEYQNALQQLSHLV
jgi:tetratricopeptide (TPR) repeat protein